MARWIPPRARVREVIEVTHTEGEGTEESPKRRVRYYYTLDGRVLARADTWEDKDLAREREEQMRA